MHIHVYVHKIYSGLTINLQFDSEHPLHLRSENITVMRLIGTLASTNWLFVLFLFKSNPAIAYLLFQEWPIMMNWRQLEPKGTMTWVPSDIYTKCSFWWSRNSFVNPTMDRLWVEYFITNTGPRKCNLQIAPWSKTLWHF
jgi:hypothetical protein